MNGTARCAPPSLARTMFSAHEKHILAVKSTKISRVINNCSMVPPTFLHNLRQLNFLTVLILVVLPSRHFV